MPFIQFSSFVEFGKTVSQKEYDLSQNSLNVFHFVEVSISMAVNNEIIEC